MMPAPPARWTAVLERIAGTEEAACLQMLAETPAFAATLDEAARLWDGRGADFRAAKVLARLGQLRRRRLREAAPTHRPDCGRARRAGGEALGGAD